MKNPLITETTTDKVEKELQRYADFADNNGIKRDGIFYALRPIGLSNTEIPTFAVGIMINDIAYQLSQDNRLVAISANKEQDYE